MDNSAKLAIFNKTQYGVAQAFLKAQTPNTTITKTTKFTMADGKVLVRTPTSSKIDFKSLFASMHDNVDNTTTVSNFKKISDNMMSSYAKQTKSYLNKKINS